MDPQIASSLFEVEASELVVSVVDRRANELFQKWLGLDKYKSLQMQIDRRLDVLNPLMASWRRLLKLALAMLVR